MTRQPGDKIIPKLIPVIRDTVIATKKGLAGHERAVRRDATQEIIDKIGLGVADFYRPLVDKMLDNGGEDLSDEVRQFLHNAKSGEHQEQALAGLLLGPVAGAIGTLLSNELAPIVYRIVRSNPNLQNPPNIQAEAASRGIVSYNYGQSLTEDQGFGGQQFDELFQLAQTPPDLGSIQAMVSRGVMAKSDAEYWMRRNGYPQAVIDRMIDLHITPLSPADAALAVLRGNLSHADGVAAARNYGVDPSDFEVLIGNTGEPPGIQDMLFMYRRGIIDEAKLRHGILQSRVRNEWIPFIEQSRYVPMTTADAIDATVQNHLSDGEARHIAQQNGLLPAHYDPLRETAGSPLSKTEMLKLFRQGKASRAEVVQALRESRLKDKYIDHALQLSVQIPPLFTIRALLTSGSISDQEAAHLLREDGYEENVVKAIIQSAHKTKTQKARDLTEGMLSALYREQAISASEFKNRLQHLGYSQAEAEQIQTIDDWAIVKTGRDQAIASVRIAFVSHKISDQEAQNELHQLLVPANMVAKLMDDWKLERRNAVRLLTPAQIIAAWKIKIIDTAEALARLVNLGYAGKDAGLLLEIANKGPLPAG